MIFFWGNKKKKVEDISIKLNEELSSLKKVYNIETLTKEQTKTIDEELSKYGYIRRSHQNALTSLSPEEVVYALFKIFELNNTFNDNKITVNNETISPAIRAGYKDSTWLQKEQHNIKLINLAALGNGNDSDTPAKFIDWIKQLVTLPAGNIKNGILATTVYLIPFHPREFGCAYLPTSSDVSPNLEDKFIKENLGLSAKDQVKLFIQLAQLAGHCVIYDILPQTGRFSKAVLANPFIARWFDIKQLISQSIDAANEISASNELVEIFKNELQGIKVDIDENLKEQYEKFAKQVLDKQKVFTTQMMNKNVQDSIVARVRDIVSQVNNKKDISKESDIADQGATIGKLIEQGLWPAPGGAWCSCGAPVFFKMSEGASYPMFKHYDVDGNDVTHFANLDCQTPYYFVYWENGKYNEKVVNYFVEYMKDFQTEYGFDGYRVDHIDHIVDRVSETDGRPISYRAPRKVLGKLNQDMKKQVKTFSILAEYMLWDNFLKEYHKDMNFDLLWGNDIISQSSKKVSSIIEDNENLNNYNFSLKKGETPLSILKTYNNQDGEFEAIDQYPGQLSEGGAMFKWFKYKFLPGGKYANRPMLYIDGDESFTTNGIEKTIGSEISMKRSENEDFYNKFTAINDFALKNEILLGGESQVVAEDEDGFVAWLITKDPLKEAILVVANQNYPTKKIKVEKENGESVPEIVNGETVLDKLINLPCDYSIVSQFLYDQAERNFIEKEFTRQNSIRFNAIKPSEFFIYKVLR